MNIDTPEGLKQAQAWTQTVILDGLSTHGTWVIPRTNTTVVFDKSLKVATIRTNHPAGEPLVERVLTSMGWVVRHAQELQ